jgi:hypothetical protein
MKSLLLSAGLMALASTSALADVINADEFTVTGIGGSVSFDDSFNRALTLIGGSGTALSTGANFSNGTAANYFVKGTMTETTNNGGQAVLDTANGFLVPLPDPFIPLTKNVQAFLQTDSHLTPANTFSDTAIFDLTTPSPTLGTYFVALSNSTVGSPGNELEMRVRELSTGPVLQFVWLDFANSHAAQIAETPITAAELADSQVKLELALNTAGNDDITAYLRFR